MIVWGLVIVGGVLAFMYMRGSGNGSSSSSGNGSSNGNNDNEDAASQVPQFVNQVYTSVAPPTENVTVNNNDDDDDNTGKPPSKGPAPKPKPKRKVGTLGAPKNIHQTHVTSSSITVAWDRVSGATGYTGHLTYQEPKSGKSGVIDNRSTGGTSMTFSGLGPDHTYTVHIATRNSAGTGEESNGPSVKTSR